MRIDNPAQMRARVGADLVRHGVEHLAHGRVDLAEDHQQERVLAVEV